VEVSITMERKTWRAIAFFQPRSLGVRHRSRRIVWRGLQCPFSPGVYL
jgi:hypothetical protein